MDSITEAGLKGETFASCQGYMSELKRRLRVILLLEDADFSHLFWGFLLLFRLVSELYFDEPTGLWDLFLNYLGLLC